MERTHIILQLYTTKEDPIGKQSRMYPFVAGTEKTVNSSLDYIIMSAEEQGRSVEELTSKDIKMGEYFTRVVRVQSKTGFPVIFGITSVFTCEE